MLALVPSDTSPRGDAIAHIPMSDGRTISDREVELAARIALVWNCHESLLTALKNVLRIYSECMTEPDEAEARAAIAKAKGSSR